MAKLLKTCCVTIVHMADENPAQLHPSALFVYQFPDIRRSLNQQVETAR